MQRKKLLFLTQSLGGVETYIREIVVNIDREKFDIVMVCPYGQSINDLCNSLSIKIYNVKMARGLDPILDLKNIWQFRRIIKKEQPALLHVHSSKGGFLGRIVAKVCGIMSVLTPNGPSYLSFTGLKRTIFFSLEVLAKPLTDRILAVSNSEAYRMQYEVGHKPHKIDVVLNAINTDSDFIKRLEPYSTNRPFRIGTIARLTYQKNPLLFVEIARLVVEKYPNVEFLILGAGETDHLGKEVEALIKRYKLEDKFKILKWGHFTGSQAFLLSLDIFVLTSIFEGLPFSLLEAMSLGIPCIGSKCDGCNDVLQNEVNGFACITKEEFAKTIVRLIEDHASAVRVGQAGKLYVNENHNIKKAIRDIENCYLGVLK
ncbi:glycosyltransferase [Dyadobacter crusticola]|uniref:glycosyltransferase n=1 Tax=Dyadobacter crusticola TaxID=292407 RepID=UPI00146FB562|nr:glycosyltransferase [Dyadobacter crusticola]